MGLVDRVADAIVEDIQHRIPGNEVIEHYEQEIIFLRSMLDTERKAAEKLRASELFFKQRYTDLVDKLLKEK